MITDDDRALASDFVLALSDLDDIDVLIDAIAASRERATHGGKRDNRKKRPDDKRGGNRARFTRCRVVEHTS